MSVCACGSQISVDMPLAEFCDPCRAQRRAKPAKYQSNPRIDALIQDVYRKAITMPKAPRTAILAAKLGWPRWAVSVRARKLGLARTKEKRWAENELAILERFAWMSDGHIRLKLAAHGFQRSCTAIHLKLKRMRFKQNTPYYTATGLANAFGVDSHVVARWIDAGKLQATKRQSERVPAQRGDIFAIHEKDVRRFIKHNHAEYDLRKVDQVWFLDLVFNLKP